MRTAIRAAVVCASVGAAAALGACSADEGEQRGEVKPPDPETAACAGKGPIASTASLRRLSSAEYDAVVRDLLNVSAGDKFPLTRAAKGYTTYAGANVVSDLGAEQIFNAAETVASEALEQIGTVTGCGATLDRACADKFMATFARRAFRRPLLPEETALLARVRDAQPAGTTEPERLRAVIEMVLQLPQFLYFDESVGLSAPDQAGVRRLSQHAIAARLSFFVWGSIPDDALSAAADTGKLGTAEEVEAQARRMIALPRARAIVGRFHDEWLHLGRIDTVAKDPARFPQYTPEVVAAMRDETARFTQHVVFEGGGTIDALFTDRTTFSNGSLDWITGIRSGSTGPTDYKKVELPAERGGVLTRPAFLAAHAYATASAPVRRGVFILEQMYCQDLVPPPNVVVNNIDNDGVIGGTVRERLAQHRISPSCAGCHDRIDPLGLAFEHFDAVGRFRTEWAPGVKVDAAGESDGMKFGNATELTRELLKQSAVRDCYATQWVRYARGRDEERGEGCALLPVHDRFAAAGGDVKELLVAIARSDAFLFVKEAAQ